MTKAAGKSNLPRAHHVIALLQQGLALQQHGHFDNAKALYERVLAIDAKNFDALNLLGVIAAQTGNLSLAVERMGKALDINPNQAPVQFNRGVALQELKRTDEALACFQRAIAIKPDFAEAHFNCGIAFQTLRCIEEALTCFQRTIEVKPDFAEAHFNCGIALQELKRTEEAVICYDRAIAIKHDVAAIHFNRGIALQDLKRTEEAVASYNRAIAINPNFAKAHAKLGDALQEVKCTEEALASYDRAIAIQPEFAEAHFNRGVALHELKRAQEAVASFDLAIAIKPSAEAYFNRGISLVAIKRIEEAVASYTHAVNLKSNFADAYANLGNALLELSRTEEALASFDRAVAIRPDDAEAHLNRGIALRDLKRTEDAIASYDKAILIWPEFTEAYWDKSLALLSLGKYEEGWNLYEWRWKRATKFNSGANKHTQPLWLGEQSLSGKTILLHAEQGLGDTIQFCRYAKLVKALGARVWLEVPKALMGLLTGLDGVDCLVERGAPLPGFDFQCPLLSLPLALKSRLNAIPSSAQYLKGEPPKVESWRQLLGVKRRPRVGLVWSGGFRADRPDLWEVNARRNLPFEMLGVLNGLDVDFISLQKGEPAESEFATAVRAGWAGPRIADYSAALKDFTDTAALIENLDVVIAVDTSVAHLAAALGKPVWILNRFDSCWRWLQNRTDSPWYPTVKLYNQDRPGDWSDVMNRIRYDLELMQ